ncbi:hypothetical protein WR25_10813 [Diploscapter pachys]|uniref:Uncharacterized protein n=1 Tax=Diploscapter pachys TaxID=2018661 RepID=A0A2A2JBX8_9BILA|nr:hypothetical protein WR25_10813 [Diploscapter pachys]
MFQGNQLRSNALGEIMAETSDDDKLMRELEEYKKEREEEKARKAAARAQKPSSSSLDTVQIEIEQMKTLDTIGKEWTEMQSAKEDEEEKIDDGESSNSTASTVYLPQGQSELFRSVADEIKQKFERQKDEDDESEVPKLILPPSDNRSGLMRTRSWQPRSRMEGRKRTDELQLSMKLVEKNRDEIKESDEEKKSSEEGTKQLERQSTVDRPDESADDVDTQQTSEDEPNLGQFSRRYAIRRRSAPVV